MLEARIISVNLRCRRGSPASTCSRAFVGTPECIGVGRGLGFPVAAVGNTLVYP